MRMLAIALVLWFLLGPGSWLSLVVGVLLWMASGRWPLIGAFWVSSHHRHHDK